jgi:eukaryotic-like serine/threonine-protein kinase
MDPSDDRNGPGTTEPRSSPGDDASSQSQLPTRTAPEAASASPGVADPSTVPLGRPATQPAWMLSTVADDGSGPRISGVSGRQIGHFILIEYVGGGSQGVVWKALQTEPLSRVVALKVLDLRAQISRAAIAQYRKEAERAARVASEGVLPIYEFGEADGHVYIAMQFVDGFTLAKVIDQRRDWLAGKPPADLHRFAILPEREYLEAIVGVISKVARALDEVHKENVIHRDVKASNILLDRTHDERVFLADFGLARDLNDVSMRVPGFEPGTLLYMGPERLLCRPDYDEVRADVYSMGVTLFQAATLRAPFRVPKGLPWSSVANYLASTEPTRPREAEGRLPRDLEAVILKAMDREPGRRYGTAAELADDLDRFRRGEPVLARPSGRWRRGLRWLSRHRGLTSAAAAVALVGLTVILVQLVFSLRAVAQRREAQASALADLERAQSLIEAGRIDEATEWVIRAHERDPENSALQPAVTELTRAAFESPERVMRGEVTHAWQSYRLWLDLVKPGPPLRARFAHALGLRKLAVTADRAPVRITLRAVGPDGRTLGADPLYEAMIETPNEDRILDDVVLGTYWVTATGRDPEEFVERPFVMMPGQVGLAYRLRLFPRTQREAAEGLAFIPGGSFRMGDDASPAEAEYPSHEVSVADVYLAPREVTNAEFAGFLNALEKVSKERASTIRRRIWPGTHAPPPDQPEWPVTFLTYDEAVEYAAWRGCRLPTEEETEWVARGKEGRRRPPGTEPTWTPRAPEWTRLRASASEPIDRIPIGSASLFDLFGNAGEITLRPYRSYPRAQGVRPFSSAWFGFPVRSGLILNPEDNAPTPLGYVRRASQLPDQRNRLVGFRLARSTRVLAPTSVFPVSVTQRGTSP